MFGRQLLDRDTRNVRLTAEGERLLVHARAMVAQADAMLARFRAPEIAGEVRFGSPEDFASAYLPDILGVFAVAHPAVELHVTCQLTLPLVEEFEAGGAGSDHRQARSGAALCRGAGLVAGTAGLGGGTGAGGGFRAGWGGAAVAAGAVACALRLSQPGDGGAGCGGGWPGPGCSPRPVLRGCSAAVRAGLGYAVMPRAMVPPGLVVLEGWPLLAEAEIALLGAARLSAAAQALATFIQERVARR